MSDGSGAMGDNEKLAEIERRLALAKSGWRVSGFREDAEWLVKEVRRVRLERDAELAEERNAEIERLRTIDAAKPFRHAWGYSSRDGEVPLLSNLMSTDHEYTGWVRVRITLDPEEASDE